MMSLDAEDDPVDDLTIDEANAGPSVVPSAQLQQLEMDAAQEVEEQAEEVLALEAAEQEHSTEHDQAAEIEVRAEEKPLTVTIPPLRPLTIAPKPVSFKPVAGQQLLLLQGPGTGQQIKLLSTAQGISLSNLSIAKPLTIKQAPKANTVSLVSPKKVVMKKVIPKSLTKAFDGKSGQQIVVLQKSDAPVKLLPTTAQTKTLTLSEAQQMGILGTSKVGSHAAKQIVVNKGQPKAIKLIPQLRSPAKILPAPQVATAAAKAPQRIYLKQTNVAPAAAHIIPSQIIQMPAAHAGQVHQINISGKGMQYIKFITAAQPADAPTAAKVTAATTPVKQVLKVSKPLTPSATARAVPSGAQIVIGRTMSAAPSKVAVARASAKADAARSGDAVVPKIASPELTMESNGIKTRKPCNCAKSQCLKLYCDCFANGEFCFMCNCMNCFNNIENEEQRQRAIKNCLERNPNAFRPKIGKGKDTGEAAIRKHTKGCNCKRSGCLKNYCECYEAKIACSNNCKCMGCMNVESAPLTITGSIEGSRSSLLAEAGGFVSSPQSGKTVAADVSSRRRSMCRQPSNYINGALIEATSQCLVMMAKSAEDMAQPEEVTKKEIIEDFGRCLKQIIDCSLGRSSS